MKNDNSPSEAAMETDAEIVDRVRRGDVQAYGALVERYERAVLASVLSVTRDVHDANLVMDDERERLLQCVRSLPAHERVAVSLRYFEGRGIDEIANITGRPVGTITKQLSRAVERLRDQLKTERTSWTTTTINTSVVR